MCQSNGYIKLHRSLKANSLLDRCDYRAVWTELLMDADWKGNKAGIANISQTQYANRFKIAQPKVNYILNAFKKAGMIEFKKIDNYTSVQIINWKIYQAEKSEDSVPDGEQKPITESEKTNNENDKNQLKTNNGGGSQIVDNTNSYDDANIKTNNFPITESEKTNNENDKNQYILRNKKEEYKNEEISKKSSSPESRIPNDEIEILESDIPLQKRKKAEPSEEGKKFAEAFLTLLPENHKHTENDLKNWARDYDRLIAIDKLEKKEIWEMCKWARADSFWQSNFLSPCKLRNKNKDGVIYYQVFRTKIENEKNAKNRSNNTNASGLRTGFKRDTDVDELRDAIRESILNGSGNNSNVQNGGYVTG